jgi:hypothetical protein
MTAAAGKYGGQVWEAQGVMPNPKRRNFSCMFRACRELTAAWSRRLTLAGFCIPAMRVVAPDVAPARVKGAETNLKY